MSGAEGLVVEALDVALEGRAVLSGVGFTAPRGQVTALVGPNGAGKTTVLRALLDRVPAVGRATLDGVDLRALPPATRARTVAWVPQRSALAADLTAEEVVAQGRFAHGEGLATATGDTVTRALAEVDALHLRGRRFPTLSGGEAQRVLLARALATGAGCLLLDEPTSALDLGAALDTLGRLRALAREGRVVVAVLHGLHDALRFADRAVVLAGGTVRAAGPVSEVLTPDEALRTWGVRWQEGGAPSFTRGDP